MGSITLSFDTHKFVKRLLSEGFTEAQAEVIAESYQHLLDARLVNLATQQDVENCATKQDLERVAIKLENIETCLGNCATKQDLKEVATKLENIGLLLKTALQNKT